MYNTTFLIASENMTHHLKMLKIVLDRLRMANLTLNVKKCKFLMSEVQYLGHVINEEGAKPGELKVKAIKEYPIPKDAQEVRRFLGLARFFRKFVKNFALIAKP